LVGPRLLHISPDYAAINPEGERGSATAARFRGARGRRPSQLLNRAPRCRDSVTNLPNGQYLRAGGDEAVGSCAAFCASGTQRQGVIRAAETRSI
jgi:hypothetical protein